jgi:hypothetical protein
MKSQNKLQKKLWVWRWLGLAPYAEKVDSNRQVTALATGSGTTPGESSQDFLPNDW